MVGYQHGFYVKIGHNTLINNKLFKKQYRYCFLF